LPDGIFFLLDASKVIAMPTKIEQSIHAYYLEHDAFFKTKLDSCFKWLAYASTFAAHICGVKTKSNWLKQMLIAGAAEGIRYLITDNIKNISTERRPLPYLDHRSFPSGHTSASFSGAYFMHHELKESVPVLSYAGYACAVSTAVIRLMKSRHWLKDVMAGAVIGIVSAKLAIMAVNKLYSVKKQRNAPALADPEVTSVS
jgi:membrane-associated phospholipid phosphatase